MKVVCSSSGIVHPPLPGQGVVDIIGAGFKGMSLEFDMCCSSYELEHYGKERGGKVAIDKRRISENPSEISFFYDKIISVCKEKGLEIPIARGVCLARDTKRTDLYEVLLEIQKECIRLCGKIGCRYLVIRPLYPNTTDGCESRWELNRCYYLRLAETARENHVVILLENQCRSIHGHMVRSVCSDSYEAVQWIDALNQEAGEERFGFCLDVGTCSICGLDMYEFAVTLGSRIQAVVLRDCDGQNESSMLPFTCTCFGQAQTDWLRLIRGLREIGFDGNLLLNLQDTVGVFSPLLRPQLMALANATAEYFKWQIEIENLLKKYTSIALFGAGNMCRNYMKCYGEKYPPLFTCDNNSRIWGEDFCGLEVKPPEALKELPENCGIFICNIYYREIEQQLRDMGIENIEFFNDEYMPSFYFDRLKEV